MNLLVFPGVRVGKRIFFSIPHRRPTTFEIERHFASLMLGERLRVVEGKITLPSFAQSKRCISPEKKVDLLEEQNQINRIPNRMYH